MVSYYYKHIQPEVRKNVNLISLVASCFSLALIIVLSSCRSFMFNRVTIRFQAFIAGIDILRHITFLNIKYPESLLCDFFGFFAVFTDHLFVFFNVIMAINVQMLYLNDIRPKRKLELILIFFAIFFALVVDGIPFFFGVYGKNSIGNCFLLEGDNITLYSTILLYATLPPGMIYCLVVWIAVIFSLHLRKDYIEIKFPDKRMLIGGEVVNARDFVKKLYFRMSFYPVTSFMCFLCYILANFFSDFGLNNPEIITIIGSIGIRSTGLINFIALLFDPHFHIAVKSIWLAREEYEYKAELETGIELQTIRDLKKEEPKYHIDFVGREPLSFEEYIRFL